MITWRASALISALAACTGAALALAVLTGRWQLVVFAAPFVGALVGASRRPPAARAWVTDEPEPLRCLESETITVAVSVESTGPAVVCGLRPALVEGLRIDADRPAAPSQLTMRTSAQRWGRYRVPVEVRSVSASGLWAGTTLTLPAGELRVYPLADPQDVALPPADLPDRIGTRLTRHHGPGVEYADIREYVPGDSLRTVNWRVSAQRGRLHVTDRLTDRAADVVVLIDTYPQPSGPATTATERSARERPSWCSRCCSGVTVRGRHAGQFRALARPEHRPPSVLSAA